MTLLFISVDGVQEEERLRDVLNALLLLGVFVDQVEDDISSRVPAQRRGEGFTFKYGGEDGRDTDTERLLYEDVVVLTD